MIKIDLLPQGVRKDKTGLLDGGFGSVASEVVLGIFLAAGAFLLVVHLLLAATAVAKIAQHKMLEARWQGMAAQKSAYDTVFNEAKALQARMNTLRPITAERGSIWSRLMNDVSDSVPKGVWLKELSLNKKVLTISGSSVSRVQAEMMAAGSFASALKERQTVKDSFTGVDVDSIQRRDLQGLSIADFTIKAKLK
jgi:hypothetical protein